MYGSIRFSLSQVTIHHYLLLPLSISTTATALPINPTAATTVCVSETQVHQVNITPRIKSISRSKSIPYYSKEISFDKDEDAIAYPSRRYYKRRQQSSSSSSQQQSFEQQQQEATASLRLHDQPSSHNSTNKSHNCRRQPHQPKKPSAQEFVDIINSSVIHIKQLNHHISRLKPRLLSSPSISTIKSSSLKP